MRAVAIGLAIAAAIVACTTTSSPSNPKPPPWHERQVAMDQITALWTQIRDWRREAKLPVDPSPETMLQVRGRKVNEAKLVCPATHKVTKLCEDVCSLAENICDNAEAICGIANKLGKDDHQAQDKCTSATASCREATKRCCTKCAEEPPKPEPAKP